MQISVFDFSRRREGRSSKTIPEDISHDDNKSTFSSQLVFLIYKAHCHRKP
jgi:hypothetical protein